MRKAFVTGHDRMVLFPKKGKRICLTSVEGLFYSDESKRRGSTSRKVLYDKRNARVASGVETD